jgi:hypothetical protein
MSNNNNKTFYEVTVIHNHEGRRVIIAELLDGLIDAAGRRMEVANFVCIEEHECEWLKRNGKSPWFAYRRRTIVKNPEEDSVTMHWPGNLSITKCPCGVWSGGEAAS